MSEVLIFAVGAIFGSAITIGSLIGMAWTIRRFFPDKEKELISTGA